MEHDTSTNHDADAGDAPPFAPADILKKLRLMTEGQDAGTAPTARAVRLSKLTREPELFQPRGLDERHISELGRALRLSGKLDPLKVMQVGSLVVLLDGHHRAEAYERVGVTRSVPVQWFTGTLEEAVLEAGRANNKAKLPMTNWDRQQYAWRLVLLGGYSKKQTMAAASVSAGQVAIMRRAKAALGDEAFDCRSWQEALQRVRGVEPWTDEERDEWVEAQANQFADRMSREFGTKLANNSVIAARALEIHFGRRLPGILAEISPEHRGEGDDDDEEHGPCDF